MMKANLIQDWLKWLETFGPQSCRTTCSPRRPMDMHARVMNQAVATPGINNAHMQVRLLSVERHLCAFPDSDADEHKRDDHDDDYHDGDADDDEEDDDAGYGDHELLIASMAWAIIFTANATAFLDSSCTHNKRKESRVLVHSSAVAMTHSCTDPMPRSLHVKTSLR